ncbi:MAG TPA: LOG family protein, partial [Acidimicrobiales bacterium]|nr:LOG family protein [Acidimicrobiales bacterium]
MDLRRVCVFCGSSLGARPGYADAAHTGLDDLRIAGTMHERKALMAELADGFVALPGGFGTFEEFCEVLTWSQLGLHSPPKP